MSVEPPSRPKRDLERDRRMVPAAIAGGVALVLMVGALLHHRAAMAVNTVALATSPKTVSVVRAIAALYRPTHRYVGTLRPWTEAKVGPQFVAAYVNTILVRPGAVVTRNQVLGTLDCRNVSARRRAVDLQARGLQAEQQALAAQVQRMTGLLDGGYIALNEVDQNTAQSSSQQARMEAERARLVEARLSVDDCILRAPFDGDIGERWVDPGAFVRPGEPVVSVVDRDVIRVVVDVPEDDFAAVAPGNEVQVHLLALARDLVARISRRSPSADPSTRTIHTEIDLPNPEHLIPVNTTAEVVAATGPAVPATSIPVIAADLTQDKARVFIVADSRAHADTLLVLGESGAHVYFQPQTLPDGTEVVLEGRAALFDKDTVSAKTVEAPAPAVPGSSDGSPPLGKDPSAPGAPR